jgi:hypothetical protein
MCAFGVPEEYQLPCRRWCIVGPVVGWVWCVVPPVCYRPVMRSVRSCGSTILQFGSRARPHADVSLFLTLLDLGWVVPLLQPLTCLRLSSEANFRLQSPVVCLCCALWGCHAAVCPCLTRCRAADCAGATPPIRPSPTLSLSHSHLQRSDSKPGLRTEV